MTPSTSSLWYVVQTKPRQERLAAAALELLWRTPTFLPEVIQPQRGRRTLAPLFPAYLFVQADLAQTPLSGLNATPGVVRVVEVGGRPQPVPAAVVEALRRRVEEVNEAGGLPTHPFRPGEVVRIARGPLAGLEAVFLGPMRPAQRVRVLLNFLGGLTEAEIEVEALAQPPPAERQRVRRTRGRGRRIR
ncbi:MAG: transcription termination/antitermination NusG family protein, partial [Anaerolineae bacterium]|nr:transcription termination/antitermination NusG family protein [Anaerolineae bacterium]